MGLLSENSNNVLAAPNIVSFFSLNASQGRKQTLWVILLEFHFYVELAYFRLNHISATDEFYDTLLCRCKVYLTACDETESVSLMFSEITFDL